MDETDLQILQHLTINARIAMKELANLVDLSAPAVTDRVRRLEDKGVIKRFTIELDLFALGYTIEAIVRIKPRPGSLHIVERMILEEKRFTSCDKVTGEDCFITRLILKSISELDELLDPFHDKAETNTSIVKSSPIKNRSPEAV